MSSLISVVIPAFNAEKFVEISINSCLQQTYRNIEVIVVNDGSIDSTQKIVENIQLKDNRVKLINKSNGGLVSARKEALYFVNGEFVFFLDADDTIKPQTIEVLAQHAADYDIIIGDMLLVDEKGKKFRMQHENRKYYDDSKEGIFCNYLSKHITPSLCGRLIRREILNPFETPDNVTIGEDFITNLIIVSKHAPRIKVVNEYLYYYIQQPDSMVNNISDKVLNQRLLFIKWVIDFFSDEKATSRILKSLSHFVLAEYYAFLRDGGHPKDDISVFNSVIKDYGSLANIFKFPIWISLMLISFKLNIRIGLFVRKGIISIRKLLQK